MLQLDFSLLPYLLVLALVVGTVFGVGGTILNPPACRMFDQQLPAFNPVAANAMALLQVPKLDNTLNRVLLRYNGTTGFTKAGVTAINVKKGSRLLHTYTGAELDKINTFKGLAVEANTLVIDFNERDMTDLVSKEVGGIDMSLSPDPIYIEAHMPNGVTTPALSALAFYSDRQQNPLVKKFVKVTAAMPAGRSTFNFDPKGAQVLRAYFMYSGTDWGAAANGNLARVEVRKNGVEVFNRSCLENRFINADYKKTPQAKTYVVDKVEDNNLSSALGTGDARSLEWWLTCTAADTVVGIFEVLDLPDNL